MVGDGEQTSAWHRGLELVSLDNAGLNYKCLELDGSSCRTVTDVLLEGFRLLQLHREKLLISTLFPIHFTCSPEDAAREVLVQ